MSAIGFPILGDKLYGPEGSQPFLDYIETGMTDELLQRLGHHRHALHAYELELSHPSTGDATTLTAPFPEDMVRLWGTPLGTSAFASARAC
jgi:23S rRNA-/tRNA-specific pseudouridylate synthase